MIGADSLGYLSVKGLMEAIGLGGDKVCAACFNGDYPIALPEGISKQNGKACDSLGEDV
jgi:amidophosphoribosyltransferase